MWVGVMVRWLKDGGCQVGGKGDDDACPSGLGKGGRRVGGMKGGDALTKENPTCMCLVCHVHSGFPAQTLSSSSSTPHLSHHSHASLFLLRQRTMSTPLPPPHSAPPLP